MPKSDKSVSPTPPTRMAGKIPWEALSRTGDGGFRCVRVFSGRVHHLFASDGDSRAVLACTGKRHLYAFAETWAEVPLFGLHGSCKACVKIADRLVAEEARSGRS